MLKWSVNAPRQSYLPTPEATTHSCQLQPSIPPSSIPQTTHSTTTNAERRKLKRKSSDFYLARRLTHWLEKENQLTSTPLHSTLRHSSHSSLRRLGSLKDLSNIVPESHIQKPPLPVTPEQPTFRTNNPQNYASTLPSYDVEYSPGGLIPGPILALRGLGVADAYFEKPRYLAPDTLTKANVNKPSGPPETEASSLSSSKMGDLTLERMIDSILESTRKEKKPHKPHWPQQPVMSPTYTPAEDPANDLNEFWDARRNEMLHQQRQRKRRRSLPVKMRRQSFNEREVRSPVGVRVRMPQESLHLRRQRGVRRKRRLSRSEKKVTRDEEATPTVNFPAPSAALEQPMDCGECESLGECHSAKRGDNTSPDSGHNSCSDVDDSTLEGSFYFNGEMKLNETTKVLDQTKRRLSFSNRLLDKS